MNTAIVIEAFSLPEGTFINQRVPKKLFMEQGAPTPADKRHIQDGIEELQWLAALKPTSIGVPAFSDTTREYLEIAVLAATFRSTAKASRLIELIHRAIPYPVVLVASQEPTLFLSLAHKRWSQGETGKVVVEGAAETTTLGSKDTIEVDFLKALSLANQPRQNLYGLYQGWIDCVTALSAGRLSGVFVLDDTPESAANRRTMLNRHALYRREIAMLRQQVAKERQLSRRVELNLKIQFLEAELLKTGDAL